MIYWNLKCVHYIIHVSNWIYVIRTVPGRPTLSKARHKKLYKCVQWVFSNLFSGAYPDYFHAFFSYFAEPHKILAVHVKTLSWELMPNVLMDLRECQANPWWTYCWWKKSCTSWIGSLSHYLHGFIHPRWLFGISSINSSSCTRATFLPDPVHSPDKLHGDVGETFLMMIPKKRCQPPT